MGISSPATADRREILQRGLGFEHDCHSTFNFGKGKICKLCTIQKVSLYFGIFIKLGDSVNTSLQNEKHGAYLESNVSALNNS